MNNIQKAILKELNVEVNERFKLKHIRSNTPEPDEFYFDNSFKLMRVLKVLNVLDGLGAEKNFPCSNEEYLMIINGDYKIIK